MSAAVMNMLIRRQIKPSGQDGLASYDKNMRQMTGGSAFTRPVYPDEKTM